MDSAISDTPLTEAPHNLRPAPCPSASNPAFQLTAARSATSSKPPGDDCPASRSVLFQFFLGNCSELKGGGSSPSWERTCSEETNRALPISRSRNPKSPADIPSFPSPVTSLYHSEAKMRWGTRRQPGETNLRRHFFILGLSLLRSRDIRSLFVSAGERIVRAKKGSQRYSFLIRFRG